MTVQSPGGGLRAGARRTDPPSSHNAARQLEMSSALSRQCQEVLGLVRSHPGRTSKELGAIGARDAADAMSRRYQVARRLPELERRHFVEARGRKDSGPIRWWPVLVAAAGTGPVVASERRGESQDRPLELRLREHTKGPPAPRGRGASHARAGVPGEASAARSRADHERAASGLRGASTRGAAGSAPAPSPGRSRTAAAPRRGCPSSDVLTMGPQPRTTDPHATSTQVHAAREGVQPETGPPSILLRKPNYVPPEAAVCFYCRSRYAGGTGRHWCDAPRCQALGRGFLKTLHDRLQRDAGAAGLAQGVERMAPDALN